MPPAARPCRRSLAWRRTPGPKSSTATSSRIARAGRRVGSKPPARRTDSRSPCCPSAISAAIRILLIDRHSSSAISRQMSDVAEMGQRLGVACVVQGSLQRFGGRLRITVRLIDASSRAQLWGESYDCPMAEVMAVPDKLTGAIVSTLYTRVEHSLLEQSRRKPVLAAYECILRGMRHLRGYGPDDNRRAVELFQQA